MGGLIGYDYLYDDITGATKTFTISVKKSFSTASVKAIGDNVGGLVGYQQVSILTNYNTHNTYNYIQESYASRKSRKHRK